MNRKLSEVAQKGHLHSREWLCYMQITELQCVQLKNEINGMEKLIVDKQQEEWRRWTQDLQPLYPPGKERGDSGQE